LARDNFTSCDVKMIEMDFYFAHNCRGYNEIEVYIPRVLCQATSFVVSMHIAFSAVILTWPFKGLIDIWSPRAIRCSIDERQGPRMPPLSLSIGIIVESGRDYYLSPFHRRDSGQSIRYRLHTYIVNTTRCLESRDTLCSNLVVPIQRVHRMCDVPSLSYTDTKFRHNSYNFLENFRSSRWHWKHQQYLLNYVCISGKNNVQDVPKHVWKIPGDDSLDNFSKKNSDTSMS